MIRASIICLFSIEDFFLEVVVVVEPKEVVDNVVNTEMVVETGLPPHMDKGDMVYEPWEPDNVEYWLLRCFSLLLSVWYTHQKVF